MKVKRIDDSSDFKPIVLEITLTTTDEARAFYNIFNHARNSTLLGSENAEKIKSLLSNYRDFGQAIRGISYTEFYHR